MPNICLEAGQVWGSGRMKMRRRSIISANGISVAFRIEGLDENKAPRVTSVNAFLAWVQSKGAALLGNEAASCLRKTFDKQIGERLRAYRIAARMSQDEVAASANISRTAVALWEGGRRGCSMKRLADIAAAIGIRFRDLAEEDSTPSLLSREEKYFLDLFRRADHLSRSETVRWLSTRAEAGSDHKCQISETGGGGSLSFAGQFRSRDS